MYRDNNNRITPEAQNGLNLQPAAAPVNQEIKYKFDTSRAEKTKALADGLAKLGKGLVDIDPVLERMADQNAQKAQLEADKNRDDWNAVSQNIKGMAIFNPYNKDAHERLKSENICKATLLEAQGKPDFEKLSPEDASKYLQDAKNRTIEALQKSGIAPKNYSRALLNFDDKMKLIDDTYQVKHQAYQYKLMNNSYQHCMATEFSVALNQSANKPEDLKLTIDAFINKMTTENGIPNEQQAINIISSIQNSIASDPSMISSAELLTTLKGLKINGTDIAELVPDYETKMKQIVKTAQRADYEDRALALSNLKLIEETNAFNAIQKFGEKFQQTDMSYESARKLWAEISSECGLKSSAMTFMGTTLESANKWAAFNVKHSNPVVVEELGIKAFTGDLTQEDLLTATNNGDLSFKDAMSLLDAKRKSDNEGATELKNLAYSLNKSVLQTDGAFYRDFSLDERTEIKTTIASVTKDAAAGVITKNEAYQILQKYNKRVTELQKKNAQARNKWQKITDGNYRNAASKSYYQKYGVANKEETTKALREIGLVATKYGGTSQTITANDTVGTIRAGKDGVIGTADDYNHVGTDIDGVRIGQLILAPTKLTYIGGGYEESMGNYAVFQDKNGNLMLNMHLLEPMNLRAGTVFKKGEKIGAVGSSGRSASNGCLHTEFWDNQNRLIDPIIYRQRMK